MSDEDKFIILLQAYLLIQSGELIRTCQVGFYISELLDNIAKRNLNK